MPSNDRVNRFILAAFFIVVLLELMGEAAVVLMDSATLVFTTKPLMMPLLMIYLVRVTRLNSFYKLILAALFFSWLGDLFLMFTWTGANLFLFGLGAFLIAHLMYIAGFQKSPQGPSILKQQPLAAIPVVLFCTGLIYGLFQYGNTEFVEMKVPVILYAGVIMVMVLAALNRYRKVSTPSFYLVFLGALLFMFSDSLIAVNKFTTTFEDQPILIRVMIMSTYAIGQYLIVEGCIRQRSLDE